MWFCSAVKSFEKQEMQVSTGLRTEWMIFAFGSARWMSPAKSKKTVGVIGLRLAGRARELAGEPVRIRGYMAPPDLERSNFFVLTRAPVITCPFCDPGTSWPDDVVLGGVVLVQLALEQVPPGRDGRLPRRVGQVRLGGYPGQAGQVALHFVERVEWDRLIFRRAQ